MKRSNPTRTEAARNSSLLIDFSNVDALPSMDQLEKEYVLRVLDACDGAKIRTCRILGVDRKTLYRKLVAWGETARLIPRRKRDVRADAVPQAATPADDEPRRAVSEHAKPSKVEHAARRRGFDATLFIHD